MTLKELLEIYNSFSGSVFTFMLIMSLSLLQISKFPINPWDWLFKLLKQTVHSLGKALNADMYSKLDEIKNSQRILNDKINIVDANLKAFEEKTESEELQNKRDKILKFYNEIYYRGIGHSREEFNNIIKTYEDYEETIKRKGLTNGRIDNAYSYIMDEFHQNESEHDFIQ